MPNKINRKESWKELYPSLIKTMEERGITRYKLAKTLNIHQQTVINWFNKKSIPNSIYQDKIKEFISDNSEEITDEEITELEEKPSTNSYWEYICKIAEHQREKGIQTYEQRLEDNDWPIMIRLTYLEEELVDALMYIEWIKDAIELAKKIR